MPPALRRRRRCPRSTRRDGRVIWARGDKRITVRGEGGRSPVPAEDSLRRRLTGTSLCASSAADPHCSEPTTCATLPPVLRTSTLAARYAPEALSCKAAGLLR